MPGHGNPDKYFQGKTMPHYKSNITKSRSHFISVPGPPLVMLHLSVTFSPSLAVTSPELATETIPGFTELIGKSVQSECKSH